MLLTPLLKETCQVAVANIEALSPDCFSTWSAAQIKQRDCVLAGSDFVAEALRFDLELVRILPSMLADESRQDHYRSRLAHLLEACKDEASFMRALRTFRRREMSYIAWRDCVSSWELTVSLEHLSELAEAMIFEAYSWLYTQCCTEMGTPMNSEGVPQPMLIIGMGKLGGRELNFSSDIDLIFTYPENGETQGARRSIANAQFFTRLGQRLIKALDQQTFDGFCYRVDLRLRPFGESGPLVMSYAALEDYYQEQGRDWERYAMVKARVMGKEMYSQYEELSQMLRPFVFRRYIDFSAIQSLRRMKSMINSEVRRRGLSNNIKLGAGGIREIEFIAQVFQLIRGGREPSLRGRGLLKTLDAIKQLSLLPDDDVDTLQSSYVFLRRVENLLQAINDSQTQTLPDSELDQQRLAFALHFEGWQQLLEEIERVMISVDLIFQQLIGEEEQEDDSKVSPHFQELWAMAREKEVSVTILEELVGDNAESLSDQLYQFKTELSKKTLGPRGREVLTNLMPKIFHVILPRRDAHDTLPRITALLLKIVTRTTYLELLDEHSGALQHLVRLCAASPMVAEQLARYPVLLDELLDIQQLYNPIAISDYKSELHEFLARIPEDDMEQQMEALRQFKQIALLRIAAADIAGGLSVMTVSDHLTYLSEAIIESVVHQAWLQVTEKFGEPEYLRSRSGKGFAVVGYGKVGGWELGYNSDLDVVFLHDCPANGVTDGKKQIDARQFYLRLAQRIIHIFSVRTTSGILYEIDTRLRPSGESGLLVSHIDAFEEYQQQEAWTWEHQALVRARVVFGDEPLTSAFNATRHNVVSQARDPLQLQSDVVSMRHKMRGQLGSKEGSHQFKLKEDKGGITDIEFLAQYLVLKESDEISELTVWSDNVRIFESMAKYNVMSNELAAALSNAYCVMRNEIHHLNLLGLSAEVEDSQFTEERETVTQAWQQWLKDV
jgi:glutamate-ammonia-ligase adenylyltransferase